MQMPILIFDESGIVEKYDSADEAERALEAIDVRNGVYEGYDGSGRWLEFAVVPESRRYWLIGKILSERVSIRVAADAEPREGQLAARIRKCLQRMRVDVAGLEDMPLAALIRAIPR